RPFLLSQLGVHASRSTRRRPLGDGRLLLRRPDDRRVPRRARQPVRASLRPPPLEPVRMSRMPLIDIAGAPRERGQQYGEQAREQIERSVAWYSEQFTATASL